VMRAEGGLLRVWPVILAVFVEAFEEAFGD
jgi:hypothetical protein